MTTILLILATPFVAALLLIGCWSVDGWLQRRHRERSRTHVMERAEALNRISRFEHRGGGWGPW